MLSYCIQKFKNQVVRLREWKDSFLFYLYKRRTVVSFDKNWFKGKRVAIIGGADSAYKEKLGEYIDSYDVVVRINNGVRVIEKYKDFIGHRTDFLFHSLYDDIERGGSYIELDLWESQNVKNIVFSHHLDSINYGQNLRKFILDTKGKKKTIQLTEDIYEHNMRSIYPYHPTTGLIAIDSVIICCPSELYITGITFFRTAHQQDYREGSLDKWLNVMRSDNSSHNPDMEYEYFKKLYRNNMGIFQLDQTLQEIIDNDK